VESVNLNIVNPMRAGGWEIPGFISARLMAAYHLDGHVLHVARVGTLDHRVSWHYVLEQTDGPVIFEGEDFSTPGDTTYGEAAVGVLSFLTLREGDTDDEFFAGYTPEQLAWRDAYAETLSLYTLDIDDEEG
jgi:hypothetical protein